MPVHIIPENCEFCGNELTVYIRPRSCGSQDDILSISSSCVPCQERKSLERSKAPDERGNKTLGEGGDESLDVVREEKDTRQHHVYELIDDRDGSVFYVGVTMQPRVRESEHASAASQSAAYSRIQEIKQSGAKYWLRVVASFSDRNRAEAFEALLISQIPTIVNKARPALRAI